MSTFKFGIKTFIYVDSDSQGTVANQSSIQMCNRTDGHIKGSKVSAMNEQCLEMTKWENLRKNCIT